MNRHIKDKILKSITILASSLSVVVFVFILGFVFVKGKNNLSIEMLKSDYWSENVLIKIKDPNDLDNHGFIFIDSVSLENDRKIEIIEVDESLQATSVKSNDPMTLPTNVYIESIKINTEDGVINGGTVYGDDASSLEEKLLLSKGDLEIYYKTKGGGIYGSLKATMILIGFSLLFAFPIGVFAAIYFNEIADNNRMTRFFRQLIDLLAGVPSIIFGLMGMVVLYPFVSVFTQNGQSILLGSLTMAVVLLPTIIKTTQEALIAVPNSYRQASLSLGASDAQTIFKVVLPSSISGLLSSLILSISRIIAESAALIFTMGTFVNDSPKYSQSATSLSVHIWSLLSHENPNMELAASIAIIILVLVLGLNLSVRFLENILTRRKV
ncbi:MAG: phosphate ABC transporter permease PstA [Erysipelothrix sp.]|nr:phosphate ABC transporter permease PstA [Erysipelothrix sp.]